MEGVEAGRWNADTLWSMGSSLTLEGSLPPATVTLRRLGSSFAGAVRDLHGNPVAGARVSLESRTGHGWTTVLRARTTARGTFELRKAASGSGLYRVTADLAGMSARSPTRKARA
jgi:hypothetical protein